MKKVREGYKITEFGEIPEEWNISKLSEITELITKGATPMTYGFDFEDEGINFIKVENIMESGKIDKNSLLKISEECNNKLSRSKIQKGDILMSIAGTLGRTAIISEEVIPANTNQALAIIRLKKINNVDYINKTLSSFYIKKHINMIGTVGAQPNLSLKQIGDFNILLPSIKEQEKIASILSTVDEQIDNVDALIEKNKELKKGLMQTLLTKGIGHIKFKKTEIGEIPEEWSIKKIDDVINLIKSGLSRSLKDEDIGVPCIRSNNISNYKFDKSDLKYWFLEDDKGANINDYILREGDILVNFINSLAQIGKTCLYKDIGRPVIYTTNIFRMNLNEQVILNKYFYYISQTEMYNNEIKLITKPAVNQASFTVADFKLIKISVPPINEQIRIVSILSEVDEKIEEHENKKKKLEELKKGLMQQLLTGMIRVTV